MWLRFVLVVTVVVLVLTEAETCKTPNNETAECVSIFLCPILLNVFANSTAREFIRQSNCGGTPIEPMVCCGSKSNFITNENKQTNLLPNRCYCGLQHSDDYFHDDVNSTAITEFPWMAIIKYEYQEGFDSETVCSGSLINQQYVLTAARCLLSRHAKPIGVLLGEYHIYNETDCVKDSFITECSNPIKEYGIEQVITHVGFIRKPPRIHDIGLIRLNASVQYSDYIRPICLPLPGTKRPEFGDLLATSGWGLKTSEVSSASETKKRSYSKLVKNTECEDISPSLKLYESQMCCLLTDNPACRGDGGGPVMYSHKAQWYQEGIISFGVGCAPNLPLVSTKVAYYLDWIAENLKP